MDTDLVFQINTESDVNMASKEALKNMLRRQLTPAQALGWQEYRKIEAHLSPAEKAESTQVLSKTDDLLQQVLEASDDIFDELLAQLRNSTSLQAKILSIRSD